MAKKSIIEKAVDKLYKDWDTAQKKAAEEALEKAKNDIYANAVSCLVLYYEDYNPHSYDRTYNLINCFEPYANLVKTKDGYKCEVGVEFKAENIIYNGSKKWRPTDSQWIIDNFLKGVHTRTNGLSIPGLDIEYYEYQEIQGQHVPQDIMQNFINNYNDVFYDNMRFSMIKQILDLTKK